MHYKLVIKVNAIDIKITSISRLVTKTWCESGKQCLKKLIKKIIKNFSTNSFIYG